MRSATAIVCARCGRFDFPHVCEPIPLLDGSIQPVIAIEVQSQIVYDVTPWLDAEGQVDS